VCGEKEMKSRKRRKRRQIRILKKSLLMICGALLMFSLINFFVGKVKEFSVVNVAKGEETTRFPVNNQKKSPVSNENGNATPNPSSDTKPYKPKESSQTDPDQEKQENNVNPPNNKQQVQEQKVVYLTFDDGPSMLTNQILDLLKREKVHATFFMVGNKMNEYPEAVKRVVQEGNYIGAHSMTHDYQRLYKQGHFVSEMEQTLSIIHNLTGQKTRLVRAPYGSRPSLSLKLRDDSARAGFKIWDWNVDTQDWDKTATTSTIVNTVNRQITKNKEVILLHEKQVTVEALPEMIRTLRAKGYAFKAYSPNEHFPLNFWNDRRF